jgi:lipopolysaccharide export system protein LptA
VAINDSVTKVRTLHAMSHVQIFQRDFQGICDSLSYSSADSTIRLYRQPCLWSAKNQCTADTIYARLEHNRMDSLLLIRNAFIISKDTIGNFNQVKGRVILADFHKNKIQRAYVRGNGQSIYFAVDEEKKILSGMNKIICSNMIVRFDTLNKLETITALVKPEAQFIPPKEMVEPEKKLKGFNWNGNARPTLKTILQSDKTTIQPKKRIDERKNLRILQKKSKKARPGSVLPKTTSPHSGTLSPK